MSRKRPWLDSPYKWLLLIPLLLVAARLAVPAGVLLDIICMTFVKSVLNRRGIFIDELTLYFLSPDSHYLWPLVWGAFAEIGITATIFLTIESVAREEQRPKSPFRWLWLILIQALCTIFIFFYGMYLDSRIHRADVRIMSALNKIEKETGRGAYLLWPRGLDYCDIYLFWAGVVFTVILTVAAIVLAVVDRKKEHSKKVVRKESGLAKEG